MIKHRDMQEPHLRVEERLPEDEDGDVTNRARRLDDGHQRREDATRAGNADA